MKKILILLGLLFLGLFLFLAALELPEMGNPKNPSQIYAASHYLEKGVKETGVENIVTAISFNYRGYDTFGWVVLIFTLLCSVLAILKREKNKSYSSVEVSRFKPSKIVQTVLAAFLPFLVLFAFYLILYSHVSPGGGFQGGMLLGGSMIIFVVIFGLTTAMKRMPSQLRVFLEGAAILAFALVGLVGVIFGANFLTLIIPGISTSYQLLIAKSMLILLQMGFAISGAAILISIFFSIYREEREDV